MGIKSKYSTGIKTLPFLYLELKKAGRLKQQGFDEKEIYTKTVVDNIFQVENDNRKREIAATIIKRLREVDGLLLDKLVDGGVETSKQIALYVLLKTDRLFFEFMNEVYREKYFLKEKMITDKDFSIFFRRKSEQDKTVASWSEYTFYKLKQVIKRILIEAGFAKKQKKDLVIIPPIIERDIKEIWAKTGNKAYLEVMLGEI